MANISILLGFASLALLFHPFPLLRQGLKLNFTCSALKRRTLSLEFCIHIVHTIYVFKQSRDSNFENFLSGQTMIGPRFKISP